MRTACRALICLLALVGLANGQTSFYIQSIQENTDGVATVTWPATPTLTYHVMYADSPAGPWQDFPDGMMTAGTNVWTLCYTDTNSAAASQRFYKIRMTRTKLIMTLVLDRSASMQPGYGTSGGGAYLPDAVSTFINCFDDTYDEVAMVSFSTTQTNVVFGGIPPQPTHPFRNSIITAANAFTWSGATFSQGGLTNALVLENNAMVNPNENVIKVVVFFTDGLANIVQDTLNCPPSKLLNFGGYDTGSSYAVFDPAIGNQGSCDATQFKSQSSGGTMVALNRTNISNDAVYRSIQVANEMRANNIIVYSIGLGTGVNLTFLAQVANDPASPTYDPDQPTGEAIIANNPSDLLTVFQAIASKILTY